ncbi:MAG TPA: TadE/TadG family type IV pilus assembly protein [Rhizomicrobium sp.]|jgi:Flp pilus assembly protein TadG|nr:TadE/TadG family type IV pilus assembly protein [Rhizomicrobium sp.]
MWKSVSGLAGIEFGFIAPVLALMLLGTIDICNVMACREKVISLASSVSDLIAMTTSVSSTDISNAYNSGNAIMYPFADTSTGIVISSITYSATTHLDTVAWSRAQNGTPLVTGSTVVVPTGVIAATDGASAILVSVNYNYTPPFAGFMGNIPMAFSFYSRPRESLSVACNGC